MRSFIGSVHLSDGLGDSVLFVMGDGNMDIPQIQQIKDIPAFAAQAQYRSSRFLVQNFHILPGDARSHALLPNIQERPSLFPFLLPLAF